MEAQTLVQSLAIRPLVLKALRQLNNSERKEFCVLYSLTGELNETHQILSALDEGNKLSTNRECLELLIVNLEAIGSQNQTVASIIEAAKKIRDHFDPPTRQESLPFLGPASPNKDSDPITLASVSKPLQEENRHRIHISQMVAGDR